MKNKWIYITAILCFISITSMAYVLFYESQKTQIKFTPPSFETESQFGVPDVEDSSWTKLAQQGMNFSLHICGEIKVKDNKADVYFTNDEENKVWLKLRILNETGQILSETGILKPGQYLKSIIFNTEVQENTKIKMKIMAYEPETYHSAGSIILNTQIGGQPK